MSNKSKFKVGDRVRVVYESCSWYGKLGTVIGFDSTYAIEVTLDEKNEFTSWAYEDSLELFTPSINFDRNEHKEVMLAWINGSEIERYDDSCNTWWIDTDPKFETNVQYRVKRKVKVFKYKFAKLKSTKPALVYNENYAIVEQGLAFSSWLTDEITVEYPED